VINEEDDIGFVDTSYDVIAEDRHYQAHEHDYSRSLGRYELLYAVKDKEKMEITIFLHHKKKTESERRKNNIYMRGYRGRGAITIVNKLVEKEEKDE
jgi:hypothetical protein